MTLTQIVSNWPIGEVGNAIDLYRASIEFDVGMDLGWVGSLAPAATRAHNCRS